MPANYPTNQFYVGNDGSVWQYSASQGTWLNQGKPYNVNAPTAVTASQSPVPAGYPTSAAYTDSTGNVWTWNGSTWIISGSVYSGGQLTSTAGVTPPVSVNVSPSAAVDSYQTILDWLTQQTLITGVPNWLIAAGVGIVGYKVLGKGGR